MDIKRHISKYYTFIFYLVIIVLVNLVALRIFFRFDLTASGLYSLSRASKKAVATLREPMTINVFFSRNLPAPYNTVESYLHDLLDEYTARSKDYLSYRFFDVSAKEGDLSERAEENRQMAQDYGIYPVNVQTIEHDEAKIQRTYMGMVFIHGDIIERIPAVTSTEGLEYQITSTIQKMNNKISALINLEEKIKVKLVQSSSLNQIAEEIGLTGLDSLRASIQNSVDTLQGKVYDQLEFVFIDPATGNIPEDELRAYQRFGLQWPQLQKPDGAVIAAGNGILALGLEYSKKSIERQLLNRNLQLTSSGFKEEFQLIDMENVDAFIEDNIDNLINIHDEIGYLSSHGSLALSPSLPPQFQQMQPQQGTLTRFNGLLRENYSVTPIDVKDEAIPDTVNTLVIAGPKEQFTDWELFQIDQFLMEGKSLAVFMESFNELQQGPNQQMYGMNQPIYLPINTGLEKLLSHYGVSVRKAYVMDENCFVSRDQVSGEMPLYFAPIIKNENINHKIDFMGNVKELIMLKISPVEIDREKVEANGLEVTELFSSSSRSWEMSGQINLMPWMTRPPASEEEMRRFPLACLIEGEFPSYFADKPIPEKPEDEPEESAEEEEEGEAEPEAQEEKPVFESRVKREKPFLAAGRPGRIFLIGAADILKDNVLDEEGKSPNAVFLLNTLDYLNEKEEMAVLRSKIQTFNPLKNTSAVTRTFFKMLNVGGLPVLFVLFGFFVYYRRRAKKRSIESIFNPTPEKKENRP